MKNKTAWKINSSVMSFLSVAHMFYFIPVNPKQRTIPSFVTE